MGKKITIILFNCLWTVCVFGQQVPFLPVEKASIGSFQNAFRISVAANGTMYILDTDQNTVSAFSDRTHPPVSIGGFGWSMGSFDRPTGIASDGVNIYVSDYGNHRIQRFDRQLNFISSFSTRDTTDKLSQFGYPLDVAISELGDIFVLDGENLRVLKFNAQRYFERSFGDLNSGEGMLHNPVKVLVTASRIYVCEPSRVVLFDYFGNYLKSIGRGIVSNVAGCALSETTLLLASPDTLWQFLPEGDFQNTIPRAHVLTGEPLTRIQDIALSGEMLYILSPKKLFIFKYR